MFVFISVCDLLIIKLIQPELIVILLYRTPSFSGPQFEDVILKMKYVMFKLASPLPNIIMLGDFNLPTMSQPGHGFISRIYFSVCGIIISSTICLITTQCLTPILMKIFESH